MHVSFDSAESGVLDYATARPTTSGSDVRP